MANFISRLFSRLRNQASPQANPLTSWLQGNDYLYGKRFSKENFRKIHTAYRCDNIISDDIAGLPLQVFKRIGERLAPVVTPSKNVSYLLEIEPNPFMNPFIFKKTVIRWLINWGAAYIWVNPRRDPDESGLTILPSDRVTVLCDGKGNIWYQVLWQYWEPLYEKENNPAFYPDVEVLKLLINSDDGLTGRSVLTFARESMERQLGAHDTQGRLHSQGLNPGGILWVPGELNKEAREKLRKTYEESMSGSENSYRIAVLDNTVSKFEQITMTPSDAQFLESIQATDVEIANFYGMPLYKLNLGKQSYESNAQLNLDYLKTTLDPYLIQWESEARRKWLSIDQQVLGWYFKFNRSAILSTDPSTRAQYLEKKIFSGQLTPNEACEIEDMPPYAEGNQHYIPANMVAIKTAASVVNEIGGDNVNESNETSSNGRGEVAKHNGRGHKNAE
jgi:HK97 family phage portal protein